MENFSLLRPARSPAYDSNIWCGMVEKHGGQSGGVSHTYGYTSLTVVSSVHQHQMEQGSGKHGGQCGQSGGVLCMATLV